MDFIKQSSYNIGRFPQKESFLLFFKKILKSWKKTHSPVPIIIEGKLKIRKIEVIYLNAHESRDITIITPKWVRKIPYNHNLIWLPMFYALPYDLVKQRPAYLNLPRNIHKVMESPKYMEMVESDVFLELVLDCYAWAIWQFIRVPKKDGTYQSIPGTWDHYSGHFPLWKWSYEIVEHIRAKFESEMNSGMHALIYMKKWEDVPMLSFQQYSNLVGNLTDMIVKEQNWQPIFDEVWNNRQIEDYDGESVYKRDFMRSWNHSRTAQHISIEEIAESGAQVDSEALFEIEDPRSEFEQKVVSKVQMEQFKEGLKDRDKIILQMRFEGYTYQEIADKVGFKTPSAVKKHIDKIAVNREDYLGDEYRTFLSKHIK